LQWQAPSSIPVSGSCINLLQHILVPDPEKRYSIAQIYEHPWFKEHLPSEVSLFVCLLACLLAC
jgi:serine/threonine protein kinase